MTIKVTDAARLETVLKETRVLVKTSTPLRVITIVGAGFKNDVQNICAVVDTETIQVPAKHVSQTELSCQVDSELL